MAIDFKKRRIVDEMKRSLSGSSVLVVGFGKSGEETARVLASMGAKISIYDDKPVAKITASTAFKELSTKGAIYYPPGTMADQIIQNVDLVIQSPGVPYDHPLLTTAMVNLVPFWSEIELAYRLIDTPIIGITGTNGKTTTTTLVGEILKADGTEARVAGNIGKPLISVSHLDNADVVVAEISSFQLESVETFQPFIAAILNLAPDHLDRHYMMDRYLDIKMRIFERQTEDNFAIINFDDETLREKAQQIPSRVIFFSRREELENGVFIRQGKMISRIDEEKEICSTQLAMRGVHNLENALAAAAIALCAGASPEAIGKSLRSFRGVEHRIEFVAEIRGIRFFNDSKATNPDSAIVALKSFDEPLVLIAGGLEKGTPFDDLSRAIATRCKGVVLIGEAAGSISSGLKDVGFGNVKKAESLDEAVKAAFEFAEAGDVVLLSPACASFDMFDNFEVRGNIFKEAVWSLKG